MNLLLKHLVPFLLKKISYRYLIIFFLTIASIILCLPIIQLETDIDQSINNSFDNKINFDKYYKFPNHKDFIKIKKINSPSHNVFPSLGESDFSMNNKETVFNYVTNNLLPKINQEKPDLVKNFQHFFSNRVSIYNPKIKKNYFLLTSDVCDKNQQSFEKIFISKGKKPKCLSPPLSSLADQPHIEAIVNTKFASLNKIEIGDFVEVSDDIKLKIVGIGDANHQLSLNFIDTSLALNISANEENDKVNLYEYLGFFYLQQEIFWQMYVEEYFFNYDNFFYYKSDLPTEKTKEIDQWFKQKFKEEFNYQPEIFNYDNSQSFGLKRKISNWIILLLIVTMIVVIFFNIFFLCYSVHNNFTKKPSMLGFLINLGYSKWSISKSYFQIHFFLFLLISIVGYFLSFFLYDYFFFLNQRLYFFNFTYQPFDFIFLLVVIFLFTLLPSFFVFLLVYFFINNKSGKWLNITFFSLFPSQPFWSKIFFIQKMKIFFKKYFLYSVWLKMMLDFFFRDFWKKLLFIFFLSFIFLALFAFFFLKISSDNFFNKQWNFLEKNVKSFTKFKHSTFFSSDKERIYSNHNFEINQPGNYETINSFDEVFEILKKDKPDINCLSDLSNLDESLDCLAKDFKEKLQKKRIFVKTLENKKIKQYMNNWGFENVYFNVVPYDKENDLPVLILDGNFQKNNFEVVAEKATKEKTKVYFLPELWEKFFKIDQLESHLPNFSFANHCSDQAKELCKTKKIGFDSDERIPYILAPYHYQQNGYQLGDVLDFNFSLQGTLGGDIVEGKFKIAGFIKKDLLYQNVFFTDYQNLNLTSGETFPNNSFNYLFSKGKQKYLKKNVILDTYFIFRNLKEKLPSLLNNSDNLSQESSDLLNKFVITKVSIVNTESLYISEFNEIAEYQFNVFREYLMYFLIFLIIFAFFFLLLALSFLFNYQDISLSLLKTFGLRWKKLFLWFSFLFFILIVITVTFSFLANLFLFNFFSALLAQENIFFYLFSFWQYFGYFILALTIVFLFCLASSYFSFSKVAKISFEKKL